MEEIRYIHPVVQEYVFLEVVEVYTLRSESSLSEHEGTLVVTVDDGIVQCSETIKISEGDICPSMQQHGEYLSPVPDARPYESSVTSINFISLYSTLGINIGSSTQ